MAFPQTPLGLRALIAPGADPVDPGSWRYVDITDDVRDAGEIRIQAGRQDEGARVDATQVAAVVDNRSGDYCRTNPLGQWAGQLDKGTPLEVRVTRINDTFSRVSASGWGLEPNSGMTWATSSSFAANGAAGTCTHAAPGGFALALLTEAAGHDVEVASTASVPAVMTGASWLHATLVRYVDGSNYYYPHIEFGLAGKVYARISRNVGGVGTNLTPLIDTGVTYAPGTRIRTRVRAVGRTIQIRCWPESSAEPAVWHAQADDAALTGTGTGLAEWRLAGNTNSGSLAITVDDYRMDVIRSITPVPEWPVRWDRSGNDTVAPIAGAGIFRRLAQGQSALRSPQYRQISGYVRRLGHWPLEDDSASRQLANTYPNGRAGAVTGATLGSDGGPGGASSVVTAVAGSSMSGVFARPPALSDVGWQFAWSCKLAGPPAAMTEMIRWTTTDGVVWSWQVSATQFRILVTGPLGDLLDSTFNHGPYSPVQWLSFRVKVTELGGTVTVEPAWFGLDGATPVGVTRTYQGGGLGWLRDWRQVTSAATVDALFSHVFGVTITTSADNLHSYAARRAFDGYGGESAGGRLSRLADEEGVLLAVTGIAADTAAMGEQRPGTLLDLMRECEDADQGILYERGAGLAYLTRTAMYNQTPAMVLDFDARHVAAPPEPTDDDQRLRNKITLRRQGGSEVTVEHRASVLSSGAYTDELTVVLDSDSQLEQHAYWRLHLGTHDGLRWPRVELNLATNPALIASWCRTRIGSRITIANPPDQVGLGSLDLIVEGWTETLSNYRWDVVLVCSPAEPWTVGVYDDTASRYDSASTTVASTVAAGVTSLPITTVRRADCWSTSDGPFNWLIAGEEVTVTAVTAPAGTGPYTQTATVTRAVNAISKTLPAGAEVHLARPARYAL